MPEPEFNPGTSPNRDNDLWEAAMANSAQDFHEEQQVAADQAALWSASRLGLAARGLSETIKQLHVYLVHVETRFRSVWMEHAAQHLGNVFTDTAIYV